DVPTGRGSEGIPACRGGQGPVPRRSHNVTAGARRTATSFCATSRARGRSLGSKEMAATRGCPPPPYCSASEARFLSAVAWFHGFVPSETLARCADELTLTEKTHSGCSR